MFFTPPPTPPIGPMLRATFTHPVPPFAAQPFQAITPARGLIGRLFGGLGGLQAQGQSLNILSMLENTQKVLKIVQTMSPMVQQYGPLIKNLPAIYKMLKDSPNQESPSLESKQEQKNEQTVPQKTTTFKKQTDTIQRTTTGNIPPPKIYI